MNNVITLHDKLTSFVENAIYDIELDTLLESEDSTALVTVPGSSTEASKEKKNGVGQKIVAIIKAVWEAFKWLGRKIRDGFKSLVEKISKFRNRNVAVLGDSLTVSKYLVNKLSSIPSYNAKSDKNNDIFDKLDEKVTIEAGKKINVKSMMNNVKAINKCIDDITVKIGRLDRDAKAGKQVSTDELSYYNQISKVLANITAGVVDIRKVIVEDNDTNVTGEKFDKLTRRAVPKKVKGLKESAEGEYIMDKSLLRAQLLMEAAELLNEDGEAENSALVGGTANMVDDTIKDIPDSYEEKPVVDDEYDSEAVMGATSQRISDETKEQLADLCDGDKEVMDVITDDDGSAIIDNSDETPTDGDTVSESIDFFW